MATYTIPTNMNFVTPNTFPGIGAGDTIFLASGVRSSITFKNLVGTYDNPILITNRNGIVDFNTTATTGWIIYFRNCQHIKFSGTGDTRYKYGLKISNGYFGIMGHNKTEYIEFENIEIANVKIGISVKTHEDNDGNPVLRGEWIQHDTTIHDCYIHDISGEGLYLGNSSWQLGIQPELDGVYVYNNIFEDIGFEAIQVSSAPYNVEVHDNYVNGTGQSMKGEPPSGANTVSAIILCSGIREAKCYNNTIINSGGRAIYVCYGTNGSFDIYNNLIMNTGVNGWNEISDGITIRNDGICRYNTIVNIKNYGIKVLHGTVVVRDNIIAACGDAAIYGGNSFNNIESASLDTLGFVNPGSNNFHLLLDSPAVDKGSGDYPSFDLDNNVRPFGSAPDIGAFEYTPYDLCAGVVCPNICIGNDLWSQKCNPLTGLCVSDQLIESNSASCQDPCAGVVCDNICIGKDLYSQRCIAGDCFTYQLIESNSSTCVTDPCAGVVCPNICAGNDLWSQTCDTDTGDCVLDKLLQQDAINCKIPDRIPTDDSTIQTYLVLGGIGLAGLAILMMNKKR